MFGRLVEVPLGGVVLLVTVVAILVGIAAEVAHRLAVVKHVESAVVSVVASSLVVVS